MCSSDEFYYHLSAQQMCYLVCAHHIQVIESSAYLGHNLIHPMSYGEYRILGDCPAKYPHDICAIQVLSLWDMLCGQGQKACDARATSLVAF